MTKAEIAERVAEKTDLPKKESAEIVELVFETIKAALAAGDDIKIAGFGNFAVKERKERTGRNPQTGKELLIAAQRAVGFKPGLALKKLVNEA